MSEAALDNSQSAGELPDIYAMSDEELMNLDPSQFESEEAQDLDVEDTEDDSPADQDEDLTEEDFEASDTDETDDEDTDLADDEASDSESEESPEGDTDTAEKPEGEEADKKDDTDDTGPDYEAIYNQIFAPFKAGGKEIKVESPDEVVQLMQKGMDYNKKMVGLKPHLKILKTLENQGLLEEEKIGFLIDLANKDQKAIGKLLKDSGVDPLDVDVDASNDYTPSKHSVSDQELLLDEVLEEIQDTNTYGKTVNLVSKEWDDQSKLTVYQEPQLLKVINDHMATGVYDVISNELTRQRALGQLSGLSDLDAYKQVGDSIQARGGFDHLFQDQKAGQGQGQQDAKPAKRLPPKQKPVDPKLNEKRRAASPSKGAPAKSKVAQDFNPLAMSDEDFEKHFSSKLL